MIKDSGEKSYYETGAVRDFKEGKGRMDLIPLKEAAELLRDSIVMELAVYQETGDNKYLYNALRFFSERYTSNSSLGTVTERPDSIATMLLEVSKQYEGGANKYGENNWQLGMPKWSYLDSALRHYMKVLRGDDDEPHDRAFVWNILGLIWTTNNISEEKE